MEWLKSILEKHVSEDGKLNLEGAIKEINKQAPDHVVPNDQYNALSETKKQLVKDVLTRDQQLEELKKAGSVDDLQKQLSAAQEANAKAKDEYEKEIRTIKLNNAIEKSLAGVKHADLLSAKFDREKLVIKDDDTVEGIEEQIKALKKGYGDLFEPSKRGKDPDNTGTDTSKKPEEMSYEDFVAQMEEAD